MSLFLCGWLNSLPPPFSLTDERLKMNHCDNKIFKSWHILLCFWLMTSDFVSLSCCSSHLEIKKDPPWFCIVLCWNCFQIFFLISASCLKLISNDGYCMLCGKLYEGRCAWATQVSLVVPASRRFVFGATMLDKLPYIKYLLIHFPTKYLQWKIFH